MSVPECCLHVLCFALSYWIPPRLDLQSCCFYSCTFIIHKLPHWVGWNKHACVHLLWSVATMLMAINVIEDPTLAQLVINKLNLYRCMFWKMQLCVCVCVMYLTSKGSHNNIFRMKTQSESYWKRIERRRIVWHNLSQIL